MADETTQTDPTSAPDADGSGNAGTTPPAQDTEKKFTQSDLNAAISARLKREQDAQAAKEAKTRAADEEARRAKAGEWETLAAQREGRIKELEAFQTQADEERSALHDRLNRHVNAQIKGWPDAFKALVPKSDDALERWDAYERAAAAVAEVTPAQHSAPLRTPGTGPNPRPAGNAGPNAAQDAEYQRLIRTGKYSI